MISPNQDFNYNSTKELDKSPRLYQLSMSWYESPALGYYEQDWDLSVVMEPKASWHLASVPTSRFKKIMLLQPRSNYTFSLKSMKGGLDYDAKIEKIL